MLKNLLLALCLFQACFLFSLKGDETYWDSNLVRAYVHHSDLQRRWAMAFLAPHLRQLKGDEHILDIGCGDGKLTSDVSKFIPEGLMIGIDPSLPMLEWARKQYCPLEYPNLIFQEGGFLEPNQPHLFDIVLSTCALQHCPDQNQAFKNLAKLLKPNGQVIGQISSQGNFLSCMTMHTC